MKKIFVVLLLLAALTLGACAAPGPASSGAASPEGEASSAQGVHIVTVMSREGVTITEDGSEYEYCYELPAFAGQGPDLERLNGQIYERVWPEVENALDQTGQGMPPTLLELSYQAFEYEGILSLLVTLRYDWGASEYYALSVNADGTEAGREALLACAGLTEEDFVQRAAETVGQVFDELYEDVPAETMAEYGAELRERSMAAENFGPELPLVLDSEGRLCFAARIYSLAGAESYLHLVTLEDLPRF